MARGPRTGAAKDVEDARSADFAGERVGATTKADGCGLTKKCSAAGQTDDGLEPGEQCRPAQTAGPLQRLVRPPSWGDAELLQR